MAPRERCATRRLPVLPTPGGLPRGAHPFLRSRTIVFGVVAVGATILIMQPTENESRFSLLSAERGLEARLALLDEFIKTSDRFSSLISGPHVDDWHDAYGAYRVDLARMRVYFDDAIPELFFIERPS